MLVKRSAPLTFAIVLAITGLTDTHLREFRSADPGDSQRINSFVQGEGRMTKRESVFQAEFIKTLRGRYPEAIILKNDPNYLQGVPDVLMLVHDTWAAFEIKAYRDARQQPNQEHYVNLMDGMSFAAFVYPENAQDVLDELERSLRSRRPARLSQRQQVSLGKL